MQLPRAAPRMLPEGLEWRWTRLVNLTGLLLTAAGAIAQLAGHVRGAALAYAGAAILVFAFGFWRRSMHLEKIVLQMQERLDVAERHAVIGLSTAAFTHELKNSVMVVRGLAELAARQGADAISPSLTHLHSLDAQTRQMLVDLQAFLLLSRGEASIAAPLPLKTAIDRTQGLLGPMARLRELSLETSIDDVPERSVLEPGFRQALLNLSLNAVEHARSKVRLSTELLEGSVTVTLEDDGPGVDAGQRAQLFTPFASTRQGGTGLGLAQVRRAAEQEGGSVSYEVPKGGGSRFIIRLPLRTTAT
jgi:signal transduction histidine kinase